MSLTIKQAFEALSDACANGMKNPFFVMRRLKESFADVASKVVDAEGDKVTVTQTLTEGTEIGRIKVNNDTKVLYAPEASGGGINYSTSEFDSGMKWIDGKTIFGKVLSNINIPVNSYTEEVDFGSLVDVIKIEGVGLCTSSGTYCYLSDFYCKVVNSTTTLIYPTTTVGAFTDASICVFYTKPTS